MPNDQSSDGFEDVVNRRNFLRVAGVTGAAALAGCGDGDTTTEGEGNGDTEENGENGMTEENGENGMTEEDTPTETPPEEVDVQDVTVESVASQTMDMLDWNSQYAGWPNIWGRWMVYERFAQYNITENEWIPRLIQDWSIDGTTITLHVRENHTYANGDQVTAEDIKANLLMNAATGAAFGDVYESFNEPDEKTLEIEVSDPVNKTILEFATLSNVQQGKMAPPYDEFYTRYWENDEDGVATDIQDRAPKEPDYVSGIMGLQEMDSEQYILERNPEHPDANYVNFARMRFPTYQGNQSKWDAMTTDSVDQVMSVFTPENIRSELADHWTEYNFSGNWGVGFYFQHNEDTAPHISKRPVRKAITHAINRENVAQAAGPQVKTAFPTPCPISAGQQEKWLGDGIGDQFPAMQGGPEKTAELMQGAGYEQNSNGNWAIDGNTLTFDIAVPSNWSDWVTATQAAASMLENASFDASANRVNDINSVTTSKDFQMAARPWSPGNARSSFPYFPMNHSFGRADSNAINYPGAEEGNPIEVPAMDGSGTMEVDVQKRLTDLETARGDEVQPIVQELAHVAIQDLPLLPVVTKKEQSFISKNNLSAPDTDAPAGNVKWPTFYAPRVGEMQWQG